MPRPIASFSTHSMADPRLHEGRKRRFDIEAARQAIRVDPARLAETLPLVAPFSRRADERDDRCDVSRIAQDLRDGTALLWLAWDGKAVCAAAVTQLNVANGHKFCTIT